jgi:hypothetical protein
MVCDIESVFRNLIYFKRGRQDTIICDSNLMQLACTWHLGHSYELKSPYTSFCVNK